MTFFAVGLFALGLVCPADVQATSTSRSASLTCPHLLSSSDASTPPSADESTGPFGPAVAVGDEANIRVIRARYPGARTVRRIGLGAESAVYEVTFNRAHNLIVKIPRRRDGERIALAFRMERTILRLARVQSARDADYLVGFYGLSRWEEIRSYVLVQQRADGGSLEANLSSFGASASRDDPGRFVRHWREMALAVRAVHGIDFVHRDVKPANFLMHEGRLRLTDFGVAARAGAHAPGLENLISGTLSHMSENQFSGAAAEKTDDLHGLMLTYRETLMGMTVWQVDPRIRENNVRLRNIDDFGTYPVLTGLPDAVAREAHPALVAFTSRRFQRIQQLLDALEALDRAR